MGSERARSAVGSLHKFVALQSANTCDAELLDHFASTQDEAAFAVLVKRHGAMVLRVCRRALDRAEDAEDVCQATFLVLARNAASIRQQGSLASWLFGVAQRIARKLQARQQRWNQANQQLDLDRPAVTKDEPSWREALAILDEELLRLPEKYRAPLLLCFLENLTRSEAAFKLGLRANQLRSRLDYGRELLRARLVRRGVVLPAGMLTGLLVGEAKAAKPIFLASVAKAACLSASGQEIPGGLITPRAVTLSKGALTPMFTLKIKLLALSLILAGLGVGLPAAIRAENKVTPVAVAVVPAERVAHKENDPGIVIVETDQIVSLAFSPNSKLIAGGGFDKKVRIWDTGNNNLVRTLEDFKATVREVSFNPDGKTLAVGSDDGRIALVNVADGKQVATLDAKLARNEEKPVFLHSLVFLPAGKMAAIYGYMHKDKGEWHSQILIWDLQAKTYVSLFQQEGNTNSLALSPDGKYLAAALTGEFSGIQLWDLNSRKTVWEEKAGSDGLVKVVFNSTGDRLAVGGYHSIETTKGFRSEGRLYMFDVKTRKQLWCSKEPANGSYSSIAFTTDDSAILTGSSGEVRDVEINGAKGSKVSSEIRRWDSATGKLVWKTEGELGHFQIAASADGKLLAGIDDAELRLFDAKSGAAGKVLMQWSHR
jgi:RNA polymerase sigma factor (sigma-70 family)